MKLILCLMSFSLLAFTAELAANRENIPLSASKNTKRIEDNSFLIEEAYNQEDRVVQHIQNFSYFKDKTWNYQFTQEWPIGGRLHQLSFTVPLARPLPDAKVDLGDILVNYRYQWLDQFPVAMSPRFSLVAPTGDYKKAMGSGTVGFETNLPMSVILSPLFVTHWNLGARYTPRARAVDGRNGNLLNVNYGTSFVWLANQNLNIMLELVGGWVEGLENGTVERKHNLFINPGVRGAVNLGELQVVPGLSTPIGIGPSAGTYGVLAYLSFEHPY